MRCCNSATKLAQYTILALNRRNSRTVLKLNSRQQAAVGHIDSPLLVLAGAGSGKTRVITEKVVYLIQDCGINARQIAAVTFTNKAAREMKARITGLLTGQATRGLTVSTFHNLGLKILRREHAKLGYRTGFSILDAEDSRALIRELVRKEQVMDDADADRVLWQISRWKNALRSPKQALATAQDESELSAAGFYGQYQRYLKAYNAVDFDDLILQPVLLLRASAQTLEDWQNRLRYLLVDEYQDTNDCQYQLVKHLVGVRAAFTVVGDDDQSVYAWRGAKPENLRCLKADFPRLEVIKLEQNYRSRGRILKAANQLIRNNPHIFEKRLWSDLGPGDPLRVLPCRDEEHEAQRVVSEILHHRFTQRTTLGDYAILYRGNHQARVFERVLRENSLPYFLSGGQSFFARAEIKDIMAYLRLLANNDDDNAFLRVVNTPRREIGPATLEKLATYAGERGVNLCKAIFEIGLESRLGQRSLARLRRFGDWIAEWSNTAHDPGACARRLVAAIDYEGWLKDTCKDLKSVERRMKNVEDLLNWVERIAKSEEEERSLGDLVAHISLMDILERQDEEQAGDRVQLLTLHAAKGLEFPHVFITGMEEELLPHRSSLEDDTVEEERRLAYVGITRAQKTLTFTLARRRRRYGEMVACEPSRFLKELPDEDLVWEGVKGPQDENVRKERGRAHLANLRSLLGQEGGQESNQPPVIPKKR